MNAWTMSICLYMLLVI